MYVVFLLRFFGGLYIFVFVFISMSYVTSLYYNNILKRYWCLLCCFDLTVLNSERLYKEIQENDHGVLFHRICTL